MDSDDTDDTAEGPEATEAAEAGPAEAQPARPALTRQRDRQHTGSNLRRYGPLALIVVLLVGIGALVVVDDGDTAADDSDEADALGTDEVGAPAPTGRMPVTYEEAEADGTVDDHEWGDRCDADTGHVRIPTVYAAPCVPVFEGDNGGATAPGVTADTITVVRYVPDDALSASPLATPGGEETTADQYETQVDYFELYASQAELYGRTIELVDYQATGTGEDVVAARADAAQIAAELEPFAVLGGPQLDRGTFAQELTSHGIVCLDCAGPVDLEIREKMDPKVWGILPAGEQFTSTLAAWASALARDPNADEEELEELSKASYAGDPDMRERTRKIGIIHFDQDPPVFAVEEGSIEGIDYIESYILDFSTLPQKAAELIARYKSEGVTTIVFLGDPVMPGYLASAATEADYYPEWVYTGTFLTDTNFFGRGVDPEQMEHSFGISQLGAPTPQDLSDAVHVYRWYFGEDAFPAARSSYTLSQAAARWLVNGIHMAGPDLDAETFARGQFRIPPAGGGPTTPQVSFGNWGLFPDPDYSGIDDAAEIWWDPTVEVDDEFGNPGSGVWRRAHGGERFVNEDDAPAPNPFTDVEDTVTVFDELPEVDQPPSYPPPPGSPAAEGASPS